jgi:hypothetical protein
VRALSLWQPWASLVAEGIKTIETRSWGTRHRGPLAIHASKRTPVEVGGWVPERMGRSSPWVIRRAPGEPGDGLETHPVPLGAVVATCVLLDVLPVAPARGPDPLVDHVTWVEHTERLYIYRAFDEPHTTGSVLGHHRAWAPQNITDQHPFGDFTPGRFAWVLADVEPLPEPVPARGHQGLWEWTP